MSEHQPFRRLDADEERDLTRLARLEHGPDLVNESMQRWNNYTPDQQQTVLDEGNALYADIAQALRGGVSPTDPDMMDLLDRWQQHTRYFYEPTLDILRGLGQAYALDPRFRANFEQLHPELPDFLQTAIDHYVDALETAVLEQMLADDEARLNRLSR